MIISFQMSEEMKRIKGDDKPLLWYMREGLKKYGSALVKRGQCRRNPHRFFTEMKAAIPLFRLEEEHTGTLLFLNVTTFSEQ